MAFLRSLVLVVVAASAVVQMVEAQNATDPNGVRVGGYQIVFSVPCSRQPSNSFLGSFLVRRFRNATVELRCGENNMTIGSTRTNLFGGGAFFINPQTALPFLSLESNCKVVVTTSLSTCNPALPSTGHLESNIRFRSTSFLFRPRIAGYTANNFQYNPNLE